MRRRLLAGFLAGVSSVLGLLSVVMLLLISAGFFGLLRDVSFEVYGKISLLEAARLSAGRSFGSLPAYIWSARWGMVALGLLGSVLAYVDIKGARITRPWGRHLPFILSLGSSTMLIVGLQYANREVIHAMIADQPLLFTEQGGLLVSDPILLFTALLIAFGIAYVIGVAWHFWFLKWVQWLRIPALSLEQPLPAVAPSHPPKNETIAYQERMARLRSGGAAIIETQSNTRVPSPRPWLRIFAAGVAGMALLAFMLLRIYHNVGPGVMSGEFWVTSDTPRVALALPFSRQPQRVTLSNTAGVGAIQADISADGGPTRTLDRMLLPGDARSYVSSAIEMQGLPPATYRLDVRLLSGAGGLLRYVGFYGGGVPGRAAGWAFALASGLWVAFASLLLIEVLSERGPFRGTA